jgi:murein DD-endopeptidase MepM/ murein hydrolase activator NlpD
MSSDGQGSGVPKAGVALLLIPAFFLTLLLGIVFISAATSQAACSPTGAALVVDPNSVPQGPIAGYGHEQLVNAAHIMLAAQKLGLSARDQQIGVMTAMGESSLHVLDRGDAAGPDSRGLFQQRSNGTWGSYADRMNPFISATNFYTAEMTIADRESMEPTLVANAVQHNADPYHYSPFWEPAGAVVQALGGITEQQTGATGTVAAVTSVYALGPVQPQTAAVANTVGPMAGIKTVYGYRVPAVEQYDPNGHPAGLALDFMINDITNGRATGDRLAQYLQAKAAALGVKYIIWQQRIWSTERSDEGWRPMEDRGAPTRNHRDHVHLSLTGDGSSTIPGCTPKGDIGEVSLSGWAAPANGPMTSDFGPRTATEPNVSSWHRGIDLAPGCNAPIWAANTGQVVRAGAASGYGNLIEIDHGGGTVTRYGHMYNDGILAKIGDHVTAGQQIATIGSTGNSTGCHLHFEVLLTGTQVDPEAFLDKAGVAIKQ